MNPHDLIVIASLDLSPMQAFDLLVWYARPPSEDYRSFLQSAAFYWWVSSNSGIEACNKEYFDKHPKRTPAWRRQHGDKQAQ